MFLEPVLVKTRGHVIIGLNTHRLGLQDAMCCHWHPRWEPRLWQAMTSFTCSPLMTFCFKTRIQEWKNLAGRVSAPLPLLLVLFLCWRCWKSPVFSEGNPLVHLEQGVAKPFDWLGPLRVLKFDRGGRSRSRWMSCFGDPPHRKLTKPLQWNMCVWSATIFSSSLKLLIKQWKKWWNTADLWFLQVSVTGGIHYGPQALVWPGWSRMSCVYTCTRLNRAVSSPPRLSTLIS